MSDLTTFKVELEVSATHTHVLEERTGPDSAVAAAERLFMEGEPADYVGWPDMQVNRITAVVDGVDGPAIRVMRLYDIDTRGWRYVATDDATNKDLARGHDRDTVIRQAWALLEAK